MSELLYADRDLRALNQYYLRHIQAMTAEGLHSKADIAAELGYRDARIADIETKLAAAERDAGVWRGVVNRILQEKAPMGVLSKEWCESVVMTAVIDAARDNHPGSADSTEGAG